MGDFIYELRSFYEGIIDKLFSAYVQIDNITVSIGSLMVAFLITGLIITVFWRGVKT